jgi:zinc D-Ala-D-Ala dipeptidase
MRQARDVVLAVMLFAGAAVLTAGARVVSPQSLQSTPAARPPARPQSAATLLASARQMVVVTTADWNTVAGTLRVFERDRAGAWTEADVGAAARQGRTVPQAAVGIVVGKNGTAWDPGLVGPVPGPVKVEGDGRSPAGVFALGTAFGFAAATDARWLKLPYVEVTPTLECVDDAASGHYNTLADRATTEGTWSSSEKMRQVSPEYHWGVVVEYNARPVVPKRGSCIFLHIGGAGGRGTAGCTAMAETTLKAIMRWLDPKAAPVLVQLPAAAYEALRAAWSLPALAAARAASPDHAFLDESPRTGTDPSRRSDAGARVTSLQHRGPR